MRDDRDRVVNARTADLVNAPPQADSDERRRQGPQDDENQRPCRLGAIHRDPRGHLHCRCRHP